MCLGGGDSGAGEARRQEDERQKRIRDSINKVNEIFGGPITEDIIAPPKAAPTPAGGQQPFPGLFHGGGTPAPAPAPQQQTRIWHPDFGGSNLGSHVARTAPGEFTPEYFGGLEKSYSDYYKPQLDQQFKDAREQTALTASRRGAADSSSAGESMGRLVEQMLLEQGGLAGRAKDFINQQKGTLEDQRTQLVSLANTGVGSEQIANIAAQKAAALSKPAEFSPLGDVFQKATALAANARIAANAGYRPLRPLIFGGGGGSSGGGGAVTSVG